MNQPIHSPHIFWKRLVERGAVTSSSLWLSRRMVASISTNRKNKTLVELGAGTGSFTRLIIEKLGPTDRLIVIEINPELVEALSKKYSDERVSVIQGDASLLTLHLKQRGIQKVDFIISGLPLGNFSTQKQNVLYSEIRNVLKTDGIYVQFQYFMVSFRRIKKWFETISIEFEPRNIPPAFVMTFRKKMLE